MHYMVQRLAPDTGQRCSPITGAQLYIVMGFPRRHDLASIYLDH